MSLEPHLILVDDCGLFLRENDPRRGKMEKSQKLGKCLNATKFADPMGANPSENDRIDQPDLESPHDHVKNLKNNKENMIVSRDQNLEEHLGKASHIAPRNIANMMKEVNIIMSVVRNGVPKTLEIMYGGMCDLDEETLNDKSEAQIGVNVTQDPMKSIETSHESFNRKVYVGEGIESKQISHLSVEGRRVLSSDTDLKVNDVSESRILHLQRAPISNDCEIRDLQIERSHEQTEAPCYLEGVLRGGASPTETSTPDLSQVRGDRGRNIENLFSLCGDKGDKPDLEKVVCDGDVEADKSRRVAAFIKTCIPLLPSYLTPDKSITAINPSGNVNYLNLQPIFGGKQVVCLDKLSSYCDNVISKMISDQKNFGITVYMMGMRSKTKSKTEEKGDCKATMTLGTGPVSKSTRILNASLSAVGNKKVAKIDNFAESISQDVSAADDIDRDETSELKTEAASENTEEGEIAEGANNPQVEVESESERKTDGSALADEKPSVANSNSTGTFTINLKALKSKDMADKVENKPVEVNEEEVNYSSNDENDENGNGIDEVEENQSELPISNTSVQESCEKPMEGVSISEIMQMQATPEILEKPSFIWDNEVIDATKRTPIENKLRGKAVLDCIKWLEQQDGCTKDNMHDKKVKERFPEHSQKHTVDYDEIRKHFPQPQNKVWNYASLEQEAYGRHTLTRMRYDTRAIENPEVYETLKSTLKQVFEAILQNRIANDITIDNMLREEVKLTAERVVNWYKEDMIDPKSNQPFKCPKEWKAPIKFYGHTIFNQETYDPNVNIRFITTVPPPIVQETYSLFHRWRSDLVKSCFNVSTRTNKTKLNLHDDACAIIAYLQLEWHYFRRMAEALIRLYKDHDKNVSKDELKSFMAVDKIMSTQVFQHELFGPMMIEIYHFIRNAGVIGYTMESYRLGECDKHNPWATLRSVENMSNNAPVRHNTVHQKGPNNGNFGLKSSSGESGQWVNSPKASTKRAFEPTQQYFPTHDKNRSERGDSSRSVSDYGDNQRFRRDNNGYQSHDSQMGRGETLGEPKHFRGSVQSYYPQGSFQFKSNDHTSHASSQRYGEPVINVDLNRSAEKFEQQHRWESEERTRKAAVQAMQAREIEEAKRYLAGLERRHKQWDPDYSSSDDYGFPKVHSPRDSQFEGVNPGALNRKVGPFTQYDDGSFNDNRMHKFPKVAAEKPKKIQQKKRIFNGYRPMELNQYDPVENPLQTPGQCEQRAFRNRGLAVSEMELNIENTDENSRTFEYGDRFVLSTEKDPTAETFGKYINDFGQYVSPHNLDLDTYERDPHGCYWRKAQFRQFGFKNRPNLLPKPITLKAPRPLKKTQKFDGWNQSQLKDQHKRDDGDDDNQGGQPGVSNRLTSGNPPQSRLLGHQGLTTITGNSSGSINHRQCGDLKPKEYPSARCLTCRLIGNEHPEWCALCHVSNLLDDDPLDDDELEMLIQNRIWSGRECDRYQKNRADGNYYNSSGELLDFTRPGIFERSVCEVYYLNVPPLEYSDDSSADTSEDEVVVKGKGNTVQESGGSASDVPKGQIGKVNAGKNSRNRGVYHNEKVDKRGKSKPPILDLPNRDSDSEYDPHTAEDEVVPVADGSERNAVNTASVSGGVPVGVSGVSVRQNMGVPTGGDGGDSTPSSSSGDESDNSNATRVDENDHNNTTVGGEDPVTKSGWYIAMFNALNDACNNRTFPKKISSEHKREYAEYVMKLPEGAIVPHINIVNLTMKFMQIFTALGNQTECIDKMG